LNYMILGMSIAGLLDLTGTPLDYLKAFNQLLHEYEYYSTHEPGATSAKPKMRNFFKPAKGAPTKRSDGSSDLHFTGETTANPSSYTYLNLVNMPFEPDFVQTFCSLLAILTEAYAKLLVMLTSPNDYTQIVYLAFQKIDDKIKKTILSWIIKDIDEFSRNEVQSELDHLEKFVSIAPSQ